MSVFSTKELMEMLQNKLILNLKDDEMACSACKGLRFVLVEKEKASYIESCKKCYTGKLYVCPYCIQGTTSGHCYCEESSKEREEKTEKKETERYEKAKKINHQDYEGYLALYSDERLNDIDDLADWINDRLDEGEEIPDYLWAYEPQRLITLDLIDIIYRQTEDGHEGMYDNLDIKSRLLEQAQKLIDKWQEKEGESLYTFYESSKKVVIIKDLVEDIKYIRRNEE